jgi:hypothetical protein
VQLLQTYHWKSHLVHLATEHQDLCCFMDVGDGTTGTPIEKSPLTHLGQTFATKGAFSKHLDISMLVVPDDRRCCMLLLWLSTVYLLCFSDLVIFGAKEETVVPHCGTPGTIGRIGVNQTFLNVTIWLLLTVELYIKVDYYLMVRFLTKKMDLVGILRKICTRKKKTKKCDSFIGTGTYVT